MNMVGTRFGRLVCLEEGPLIGKRKRASHKVQCDCGVTKFVRNQCLRSGATQSCGCLGRERRREASKSHALSGTQANKAWLNMKARCNNKKAHFYKNYGGRGITYCKRWEKFENFFEDMGHPPSKEHSLDRIDVDGNYEKENCRWATRREQMNNTRRNCVYKQKHNHDSGQPRMAIVQTKENWSE